MLQKNRHYPLSKRFSAALSEKAYEQLRSLNARYGYGNNYLLTIILERLDEVADQRCLDSIFTEFAAKYGAPTIGPMTNKKPRSQTRR